MRVLHWSMLGVTTLLLGCEVTISQLCNSLITLVAAFQTLFILMCMILPPPHTANIKRPQPSSLDSPASPPPHDSSSSSSSAHSSIPAAESSIQPSPGLQTSTDESSIPVKPPTPQPNSEAASVVNSHEQITPNIPPSALACGLSYTDSRSEAFGFFFSVLVLVSMCMSYLLEIISFLTDAQPVQRPLLLVIIGAVSLLHKMLVLGLSWDQRQGERVWTARKQDTECHLEVNHKALAEEEHQTEPRRVLDDVSQVHSDSLHNGALVFCNLGASSISDTVSKASEQQRGVHLHAAAPQDCGDVRGAVDLKACKSESHSKDITEISKDNTCVGHLNIQKTLHPTESPVPSSWWPICLPSFVFVIQELLTSILAVINSLVMLLVSPHCLYSFGSCSLVVYLDPCLATLGVITLTVIAMPQVRRYGLLLLQGTPPDVCVSDLEQRIVSVPGVRAVHDLHIWQLTDSLTVATVHVQCHAGFPVHRCADLMSAVTKVLQSVGVSCCTVQPEFTACLASSAGNQGDASPVVHGQVPSLPPVLACSLACGDACAGSMCCTPTGKTKSLDKEPVQTLVIENNNQ